MIDDRKSKQQGLPGRIVAKDAPPSYSMLPPDGSGPIDPKTRAFLVEEYGEEVVAAWEARQAGTPPRPGGLLV
jgi:hypothetical protein